MAASTSFRDSRRFPASASTSPRSAVTWLESAKFWSKPSSPPLRRPISAKRHEESDRSCSRTRVGPTRSLRSTPGQTTRAFPAWRVDGPTRRSGAAGGRHLGVDLGSRDRRVAEQSWTTRMSAPWSSMWVAQEWRSTWARAVAQPDGLPVAADDAPPPPAGEPPAPGVEEDGLGVTPPGPAVGHHPVPAPRAQPRRQRLPGQAATGTTRSLAPSRRPAAGSTAGRGRPGSARRARDPQAAPVETSRMARSRRATASSPVTAPRSDSTSASESALGSPEGTLGRWTSPAGLEDMWPSSSRNRCRDRTDTSARPPTPAPAPRPAGTPGSPRSRARSPSPASGPGRSGTRCSGQVPPVGGEGVGRAPPFHAQHDSSSSISSGRGWVSGSPGAIGVRHAAGRRHPARQ